MPLSDYTEGVGGGLKLKGVKDGRVKKSKKKSKKDGVDQRLEKADEAESDVKESRKDELDEADEQSKVVSSDVKNRYGKTEAQLRHEERRRQMLDEKMKKEGTKTHKEKVEELNKYLSRLSEHHDMPKIGPG